MRLLIASWRGGFLCVLISMNFSRWAMSRSVIGSPLTSSTICWARAGDDSAATVAMMRADSPKQLADKTDGRAGRPSPSRRLPPKPRFDSPTSSTTYSPYGVVFHDLALLGEISRVHAG